MNSAFRLFSWHGIGAERLSASEVRSREDARKLGPFVDETRRRRVLWRSPSFEQTTGRRLRRSHFAYFPGGNSMGCTGFTSTEFDPDRYDRARLGNPKHTRARDIMVKVLRAMIRGGVQAPWAFVDERVSEFPLAGNLLEGVVDVIPEYPFPTPFDKDYRFDVALIGPRVGSKPTLLGALEIEFSHEFDDLKCLLCKALGFPLLSVDISEARESDISEEWCMSALLGTTATDARGRRLNFVYLHEMLYPVFMNVPSDIRKERRHQYIVFVRDDRFNKTVHWLKQLKSESGIPPDDPSVLIQQVKVSNEQAKRMLENEGAIAGQNWREYNDHRYIRIVLDRPIEKRGNVYLYHLLMARLINGYCDALVGYKYAPTVSNNDPTEPIWKPYLASRRAPIPLLPKQVGQPVRSIFEELSKITK